MWELFDMHPWEELKGFILHLGDARHLPFDDCTFKEVYSSQTLEHFGRLETHKVLKEWFRIVTPEGILRLDLPDIKGMINDYVDGVNSWDLFIERLYGSQDYEGNTHYTMFTLDTFPEVVQKALGPQAYITKLYSQHNDGGFHIEIRKCS